MLDVSSLPLTYLGLHLRASFKANSIWDGVIEKIECCLACCTCLRVVGLP
jgi:hypothetical protein